MFKKVIAGIASVTLALGMVALTATPASAHTPSVDATCTSLHVKLTQYSDGDTNHLTVTIDGASPAAVDIADFGQSYEQTFAFTPGAATHSYTVVIDVTDPVANHNQTQYDKTYSDTVKGCLPDDTSKKIDLCHKTGSGGYTSNDLDVNSIINHSGHGGHSGDIIPPFTYTLQGVPGSYPGQNWTPVNEIYWNNGCHEASVTPTAPSHTDAVCVAGGDSNGSYTIPAKTGVQYWVSLSGDVAANYSAVAAGTYPVEKGQTVWIKATELPGYDLSGDDSQYKWHWTIAGTDASKCVLPTQPSVVQEVCTGAGTHSGASYTLPAITGIKYQKQTGPSSWADVSGTVAVTAPATVVIRAVALTGYTIAPGSTSPWTLTFASAGDCITLVTPTAPSSTDGFCYAVGQNGNGSYTIPAAVTGTKYQVKFTAGGAWADKAAGTYPLAVGAEVFIQAVPLAGYGLTGTTSWHFVIGGPTGQQCVAPAAPTVEQAICDDGELSQASYTVPSTTGIQYQQWDGATWVNIGSGTVNVNTFPTTIQWRAVAIAPYVIAPGATTTWTLTLNDAGECLKTVTAIADIDQAVCAGNGVIEDGNYIISTSEGVYYEVSLNDGAAETKAAGTYPVAVGTKVTITAHALPGYELTGTTTWTDTIEVPEECIKAEGDPTFQEGCDRQTNTFNSPTFKVFAADHVSYTWKLNDVDQGAIVPGTYGVNPGDKVEITAHAEPGFELNENPWLWTHTFADPTGSCVITPPVLECNVLDDEETKGPLSLTLPPVAHVKWIVDGAPAASGPISVPLSILDTHISAVTETGYVFSAGQTSWTFGLDLEGECSLPTKAPIPTNVTFTAEHCTDGKKVGATLTVGQILAGDDVGDWFPEAKYYLDGSLTALASITSGIAAGPHVVTATVTDPDDAIKFGYQSTWEFTVPAAPATCDLTTLALTGAGSNPIGWAGIGYYLLVTGLALIAVRTVRRRNEVKQ